MMSHMLRDHLVSAAMVAGVLIGLVFLAGGLLAMSNLLAWISDWYWY